MGRICHPRNLEHHPPPARIYAGEGIAQVLFFEGDEPCDISYADKKGKYQKQQSIILPKI
jgi:dCTP deaminase